MSMKEPIPAKPKPTRSQEIETALHDYFRSVDVLSDANKEVVKATEQREKFREIVGRLVIPEHAKATDVFHVWYKNTLYCVSFMTGKYHIEEYEGD